MITRINKFTLLLLMMCCTLSAFAAPEAEYKKLAKTWTLNSDGSQEFHYTMELTLYTHAAMNSRYGESFIVYNPDYQTLKINESYTKQKDGNIVRTPSNAFVEVLPQNAANAPAYNQLKEMVVVHTGLELGATIYLDYTLTSKPGYLPELDIFEPIQQDSPIREYTLTAITPANKKVNYTLANSPVKATVKEIGDQSVTSWTLCNIPQLPTSAFVSVSNGDLPYLAATTYTDPESALQTLYKQLNIPDGQVKSLASELIKGKADKESQIKTILGYVSEQLSFSPLTLEQTGFRFRPVNEVLSTAYGTEIEKANLLTALFRAAGFKAEIVVGYPIQAQKGLALTAINHVYVAVDGHKYIFDVHSLARPQQVVFGQSPVYAVSDGSLVAFDASQNHQIVSNQSISVNDDQWTTTVNETVGIDLLPYFDKKQTKNEMTDAVKTQNGYATLLLKESAKGIGMLGYNRLNSIRKVNIKLPRLVDEAYTYELTCPDNMQLCTPAGNKEIHNIAGDLVISVEKKGKEAIIKRSLKLNKQVYAPAEYKALRDLMITWSDVNGRTLLFSVNQ